MLGQITEIRTRRGTLRVGPKGELDGLWHVVFRELRTAQQIRDMAGGVPRSTLNAWRKKPDFPKPVGTLKGVQGVAGGKLELWSRSQIEDWLQARALRRRL